MDKCPTCSTPFKSVYHVGECPEKVIQPIGLVWGKSPLEEISELNRKLREIEKDFEDNLKLSSP